MAHASDLRAEVPFEEAAKDAWIEGLQADWKSADLSTADRALCAYADKLTRTPGAMTERDVEALRGEGFDDEQVHDAIQVVSYFNYINRVADGVRVDLEPEMAPYPSEPSDDEVK